MTDVGLPPFDPEAEEAVLAALMVEPEAALQVAEKLEPRDFFREQNGWIFEAEMALFRRNMVINPITVAAELSAKKRLEDAGGMAALTEMIRRLPTAVGAPFYADLVKGKAVRRDMISLASRIERLAYDESESTEDTLAKAEGMVLKLRRYHRFGSDVYGPGEGVIEATEALTEFLENPRTLRGLPTGLGGQFDATLDGLRRAMLSIWGAETSVGKSQVFANITWHLCTRQYPVLLFSSEQTQREIRLRLAFLAGQIDKLEIKRAKHATEGQKEWLFAKLGEVMNRWPLYIVPGHPQLTKVVAEAKRHVELHGVEAVLIDHMGHVKTKGRTQIEEIEQRMEALKELAIDLDVHIGAVAHVNRAATNESRWLGLHDFHGGSAIEKDADQLVLLSPANRLVAVEAAHRQAFPDPRDPNMAYVPVGVEEAKRLRAQNRGWNYVMAYIAKNREGGEGMVPLVLDWSARGGMYLPAETWDPSAREEGAA